MPAIRNQRGFTLVELVVGLIVFAIGIGIVGFLIAPSAGRSVDPIMQVRAAELAQSLLNEITSRSFDQNSDRINGQVRCNEDLNGNGNADDAGIGEVNCTAPGDLGPDGVAPNVETRDDFNDIDDYHNLDQTGADILNSIGQGIAVDGRSLYHDFRAQVGVFYDANYDGANDNATGDTKHIRIVITTPTNQQYVFSTYRSNF